MGRIRPTGILASALWRRYCFLAGHRGYDDGAAVWQKKPLTSAGLTKEGYSLINKTCENCGKTVDARGYASHRRGLACQNHKFFENNLCFAVGFVVLVVGIMLFAALHGPGWK
jgi:hypothetical protein